VRFVRERGLRPHSLELIKHRIDAAYENFYISAVEREQLHQAHVFVEGKAESRASKVSLFIGERVLRERVGRIAPLLGTWGGEGIDMSAAGYAMRQQLEGLGRPAIVVLDVDLNSAGARIRCTRRSESCSSVGLLGSHTPRDVIYSAFADVAVLDYSR
jgi:hypothetical protein